MASGSYDGTKIKLWDTGSGHLPTQPFSYCSLQPYQARSLAFKLGLETAQIGEAVKFMMGLYKAFIETDSTLMEINPFITTKDGKLLALDCKINFDDNALFRHKDLKELRDISEEDPLEVEARSSR